MRAVTWSPELQLPDRPRVAALGAFDGLHLGHAGTIGHMLELARQRGAEATVLTFDPAPREFEDGVRQPGRRLTTVEEQFCRLREMGVDLTVLFEFPGRIREVEAEDFVRQVLVEQLRVVCVCASASHRFGRGGRGDLNLLRQLGLQYGFEVVTIAPVTLGDQRISSTLIRNLLQEGDVTRAAALLGRPYSILADVGEGAGLGAELGFPTANLRLPPEKLLPRDGVYAGVAGRASGDCAVMQQPRPAAINVGTAPTMGRGSRVVEVHLIGAHCDLRHTRLKVEFLRWLREERQFPDRAALVEQIARDVRECVATAQEAEVWCATGYRIEREPLDS